MDRWLQLYLRAICRRQSRVPALSLEVHIHAHIALHAGESCRKLSQSNRSSQAGNQQDARILPEV